MFNIGQGGVHVPSRDAKSPIFGAICEPLHPSLASACQSSQDSILEFREHNVPQDLTMTSRIVPQILDSLGSSTLNKLHEPTPPPTKKRKRSVDEESYSAAGQLATSFIVIRVSFCHNLPSKGSLLLTLALKCRRTLRLYPMSL